ncbi:hypothetical protein ABOM_005703 [Aspergillus bombycis]|uniref:DUF6590 domain-containing protein n=1 Tax=Aspergillus bombycis TaxID=109264 RepID=A0A1F8A301_9EURO|nr:hypothetical protein ABOM_005703 [Aspergillus bombycis]OGM46091.1 hypothetical protein ABOM_005703 [Aspergillus bombycis]
MASDRDPRREPTRRRQSGASTLPQGGRDLYDQALATRGYGNSTRLVKADMFAKTPNDRELPRSPPILPSNEYAHFPRYQGNHNLPFQAPNEQLSLPIQQPSATHPGGNYTIGQGHSMGQPQVQENPRTFFKVGRVFAVVWHEGMGNTAPLKGGTKSLASDRELMTVGKFGAKIFTDIRRMVVFKEQAQCAWCFPVHTYGRLGVAKASVDPSKHAVIYMKGARPGHGPNEPKMTKDPIEVTPEPYQKLHTMSRLNFGKIYTVEHNQRVLPVGKISEESMAKFHLYAKRETELGY